MVVRIEFQILATQYCEYVKASSQGDKTKWIKLMLQTLTKMEHNLNQLEQQASNLFRDLSTTAEVYSILGAGRENWCEALTQQLTQVFLNASAVDGRKEIACVSKWLKEESKIEKREDVPVANQATVIGISPSSSD